MCITVLVVLSQQPLMGSTLHILLCTELTQYSIESVMMSHMTSSLPLLFASSSLSIISPMLFPHRQPHSPYHTVPTTFLIIHIAACLLSNLMCYLTHASCHLPMSI